MAQDAPEYLRLPEAVRRFGLSRSRLYLLAGEGAIRFVKIGSATLVEAESVRRYIARQPAAQIRAPQSAA